VLIIVAVKVCVLAGFEMDVAVHMGFVAKGAADAQTI